MKLIKNIIFIGGIHGVGKGSICKVIAAETKLIHITASQILKWEEISELDNKRVENISSTQERLIIGLKNLIQKNENYLLDGHFCLLNSEGIPSRVDEDTFNQINPKILALVIDNPSEIAKRLSTRDGKIYDFEALNKFQNMEIEYAKYLSQKYSIPYVEIKNGDFNQLLKLI